jgi:hypothetical protein
VYRLLFIIRPLQETDPTSNEGTFGEQVSRPLCSAALKRILDSFLSRESYEEFVAPIIFAIKRNEFRDDY